MLNITKTFKSFAAASRGNVAIISAFALPIVTMISFGAYDYGNVVQSTQELKAAANAAALAAINEAHIAYTAREDVDLEKLVKDTAAGIFESRVSTIQGTNVTNIDITPVVENNVFTVDVSYVAKVKTSAMSLMGREYFSVSDNQRARVSALSYINFNFLFDISASMGVGATPADQIIMKDKIGCAFSCHLNAARGSSSYDQARAAGADMRIDVARESARAAIDIMRENSQVDEHMTVGLHTYDNIYSANLESTDPKASDLEYVKSQLDEAVQMRLTHGGSNTENAIRKILEKMPRSGTGRVAEDRIQYLIVLTDGVENPQYWTSSKGWKPHGDAVINSPYKKFASHEYEYAPAVSACDLAHEKGIQVFFINTEYLVPSWGQSGHNTKRFGFIEDTLHDLIPERMAQCAGKSENVLNASTPQEIESAFKDIIGALSTPLRSF